MALQTFTAGQILTAAQQNTLQANDYNWTVSNKVASYVLTAADKGTRVVMSNAGATTITVNTGLFNAGDTLFIQNIGAGTCTITAGTATVTTAGSLALAQWGGGTLYFTSASAAIFFSGGVGYGSATGGSSSSITVGGVAFTLLTFTTDATLTVTRAGKFDIFAVGGGGGGGSLGGGGGGGGIMQATIELAATTYSVAIGVGGPGTTASSNLAGYNGSPSGLASIAAGGGGGGSQQSTNGRNGGCGGGGGTHFDEAAGACGRGASDENGKGTLNCLFRGGWCMFPS